jgi:hypothetical protein
MQWLNEHPNETDKRRKAYRLMLRISDACGEFPPSMMLENVVLQGDPFKPMAEGGFAQVFRGKHEGNIVAIKRVLLPDQSRDDLRRAHFVILRSKGCSSVAMLTAMVLAAGYKKGSFPMASAPTSKHRRDDGRIHGPERRTRAHVHDLCLDG